MKVINGYKLNEAWRMKPSIVCAEDIQEVLDNLEEWENLAYTFYEGSVEETPEAVKAAIEELCDWRDEVSQFRSIEELRDYLREKDNFISDLKRAYENVHGCIFDPSDEEFSRYIQEDIEKADEYKCCLANIRQAALDGESLEYILTLIPKEVI